MSSRTASRAATRALRQLSRPAAHQQRTFLTAALNAGRQTAPKQLLPKATFAAQQTRGIKTVDFAGTKEDVFGMCRLVTFIQHVPLNGTRQELTWPLQREPTGRATDFL